MSFENCIPDWAMGLNCAITACDADARIIYMNRLSRDTFASGTADLIGRSLFDCHSPRSAEIIRNLLATGGVNCYTITKQGRRKMIYQSAWRTPDGTIGGLVEISMVIPADMPHYDRDKA